MVVRQETFTPNEAAALVELPPKNVRKELEHEVMATSSPPRLSFSELVYLRALKLMDLHLSVGDRARLCALITGAVGQSPLPDAVELATHLTLHVGRLARELQERVTSFRSWKEKLVRDPDIMGGETVFPKSRLTVRHVGEMLERGESTEVILEDYPDLSLQDLEYARTFVRAYPRVGRPKRQHEAPH